MDMMPLRRFMMATSIAVDLEKYLFQVEEIEGVILLTFEPQAR